MEGTLEEVLNEKFLLAKRWIGLSQKKNRISDYLHNKGIYSIVLYGLTDFADLIIAEYTLCNIRYEIKAFSDKRILPDTVTDYEGIPCIYPDMLKQYVGENTLVIITPMGWKKGITSELEKMGIINIITIEDLIYDMCYEFNTE